MWSNDNYKTASAVFEMRSVYGYAHKPLRENAVIILYTEMAALMSTTPMSNGVE